MRSDVTFSPHHGPQGWPVFGTVKVKTGFQEVRTSCCQKHRWWAQELSRQAWRLRSKKAVVHDGTESGVLGLFEGKPESCSELDVGGAPEVFDVVPRDGVEPLEIRDFLTKAEGLPHGHKWLARRLLGLLWRPGPSSQ